MSEINQIKTLEQLKEYYDNLTLHEKIILDQCIAFDQFSNLELTSSPDTQKSQSEKVRYTPMSMIDLESFKMDHDCFIDINSKRYSEMLENLTQKGFIETAEINGQSNFRLSSFGLQTFLFYISHELDCLLNKYEDSVINISTNEFGNALVTYRDGSREFFTNPLDF